MVSNFFLKRKKLRKQSVQSASEEQENFSLQLFSNLDKNLHNLKAMLESPSDLIVREFTIGNTDHRCAIVYIEGLADKMVLNEQIMKNIQIESVESEKKLTVNSVHIVDQFYNKILSVGEVKKVFTLDEVSNSILSGDTALYIDGTDQVLIIGSKGWENRSIEEPSTEVLVRGPREGFIENLRTNTVRIRRYIKDPNLRFKSYKIGRRSKRELVLIYIDGIVNPAIVQEVNRRLASIDLDDAPDTAYIEQWIEDNFLSPFPQVASTERPDKVVQDVLRGKVAILLDGTPFALIAPETFGETLQSPEDYYSRWAVASLIRMLRYLGAFISVFLPALYIALVTYHPGMIPSELAFSIAASREGVPFPAFVEALLMETTMELLREAGIRLPKPIGQTIGIVGGIVIGEAAVAAGIVSPIMVIIVAITAVSSFSLPFYSIGLAFRMLRFTLMGAAALFGLYGMILVYIVINIHLVNLTSIGVPYTTPFAPGFSRDWKDLVLRSPITMLKTRPAYMQTNDQKRIGMKKGRPSS
ncbi:spore germination protein [Alteribacillus bidgolensis]|uniref:Spore germination protein n=1 Tax=Alteribacillus bidgolensis TaxID=930129 RepID=A0A1G8EDL8_9BACI|nr:spore germination protein [Alteribacillus bidgolensis]